LDGHGFGVSLGGWVSGCLGNGQPESGWLYDWGSLKCSGLDEANGLRLRLLCSF